MTLAIARSRNPRALISDNFPAHAEHVRSANAQLLSSTETAPIKLRCACGKILKLSRQRDVFGIANRVLVREKTRAPEFKGVIGFMRALAELVQFGKRR